MGFNATSELVKECALDAKINGMPRKEDATATDHRETVVLTNRDTFSLIGNVDAVRVVGNEFLIATSNETVIVLGNKTIFVEGEGSIFRGHCDSSGILVVDDSPIHSERIATCGIDNRNGGVCHVDVSVFVPKGNEIVSVDDDTVIFEVAGEQSVIVINNITIFAEGNGSIFRGDSNGFGIF